MLSVSLKPQRTAAGSRGFLATARLSCLYLVLFEGHAIAACTQTVTSSFANSLLEFPTLIITSRQLQWSKK